MRGVQSAETPPRRSSIDLTKHHVHRPNHRHDVCEHVSLHHFIDCRQVRKSRRTDFQAVGFVGAVRDEINAELTLRVLDRGLDFTRRHAIPFGEQFKMMN